MERPMLIVRREAAAKQVPGILSPWRTDTPPSNHLETNKASTTRMTELDQRHPILLFLDKPAAAVTPPFVG
jgi:hypothetical protein